MKAVSLETLARRARRCTACDSMAYSHVLGAGNGREGARVMFVGEAPGRRGAGRTGVPFQGDESGRRFEALLLAAGLQRDEVFVTNAVLCNPVDDAGRNRRPKLSEVKRCQPYLRGQVEAVGAEVVVALGEVALRALGAIDAHGAALRSHCGVAIPWFGRTLVPLYHPGRRSTVHRVDGLQQEDWRRLGTYLAGAATAGR